MKVYPSLTPRASRDRITPRANVIRRKTLSWRGCGLYLLLIWWCVLLQKVGADGAASPDGLETFYGAHFSFVVSTDLDSARFDVEGLPPGLNIDGVSGVIAGEVREVGEFEVRVSVENEVDREEILLSLIVAPRLLSIIGAVARDKIYDGTRSAIVEGAALEGLLTGDDVRLENSETGEFSAGWVGINISVGTEMALAGADAKYYRLDQPVLQADIVPKELTVEGVIAESKSYDGTAETNLLGGVLNGLVEGEVEKVSLNYNVGRFKEVTVGTDVEVEAKMWLTGETILPEPTEIIEEEFEVTVNPDGAYTFFNSPSSHVFSSGNMLISFVDRDGYTTVGHVDRETEEVFTTRVATVSQRDDHNDAAIIRRKGDGMLLIAYARHQLDSVSRFRVARVTEPKRIEDWGPEIKIDHGPLFLRSYNNLHYVGDRLFNVIRAGNVSPNQAWYLMYSDDHGDNWSAIYRVHSNLPDVSPSEQSNCYSQIVGDSANGRLWIASNNGYPNSSDITTSQFCYYVDAESLTMHNPDESLIGPIGTPFDLETGTNASARVYTYLQSVGRAWNWDIKVDSEGDVYVAYQTEVLTNPTGRKTPEDRIYYHLASWDGTAWSHHFIGHAGNGISDHSPSYGAGLTLDPLDPRTFYFSSNAVEPRAPLDSPSALGEEWKLHSGSLDGLFQELRIDSGGSHYRPRVYANESNQSCLVVMQGNYTHWAGQYDCAIKAWFTKSSNHEADPAPNYADNYLLVYPVLTANITPREITVVGAVGHDKVYDGTATATIAGAKLSGVIEGEEVFLADATLGTFNQVNIDSDIKISISQNLIGKDAHHYQLILPTIRADITPRQLSVIGAIAKDKIYDGTQVTEIEGAILDGVLVDDDVMLTNHSRGYFVGTGVGSGIEVVTTMTLKGNRSRNYSLIQPFLTAQILPLGLSVTGAVAQDKVYDGLLEAEIKGAELSGVVGNDDVRLVNASFGMFLNSDTGNGLDVLSDMTIEGEDSANYVLSNPTLVANIKPLELSINSIAHDKVYDGGTQATIAVGPLSGLIIGDEVWVEETTEAHFIQSEVGSALSVIVDVTLGGAQSANYIAMRPELHADILPRNLSVFGAVAQDKIYDGSANAMISGATLEGAVIDDDVVLANHTFGHFFMTGVGSAIEVVTTMTLKGGDSANYTLSQPQLTASILPLELLVTGAVAKGKVYDGLQTTRIEGATISGVIGNDDVKLVNETQGEFIGSSVGNDVTILTNMALEGEDAANYLINTPMLSATIQPLEVKVMGALALNKTYDGGTSARITGAELSGLIDGDEIWLQDFAEGIFAQSTVGSSIPVRAAMKLGGGHSNNYVLIQPELYADILPLELSVIGAIAHPKIYDGTTVARVSGAELSGRVIGDQVGLKDHDSGMFVDPSVGLGIRVVTDMKLDGTDDGNYTLAQPDLFADIGPRPLAIGVDASLQKFYGDPEPSLGFHLSEGELLEGDSFNGAVFRDEGEGVGTYAVHLSSISVNDNYRLTYHSGVLQILPAPITIAAEPGSSKVYGDEDPEIGFSIVDGALKGSDGFSGKLGREHGEDVGLYPLQLGTLTAGSNYVLSLLSADFTITPASLSIKAEDKAKVYGAPVPHLSAVVNGFENGDTLESIAYSPSLTTTADSLSDIGVYPISVAAHAFENYIADYQDGALVVSEAIHSFKGVAHDGYIQDGLVFFDSNENRFRDDREEFGYSRENGEFQVFAPVSRHDLNKNGRLDGEDGFLVVVSGVDIATGLPLRIPMSAPASASVINPLTHLLTFILQAIPELMEAEAEMVIKGGLSLWPDLHLTEYDPLASAHRGDLQAGPTLRAAAQVFDTVVQISALLSEPAQLVEADIGAIIMQEMSQRILETAFYDLGAFETVVELLNACVLRCSFELDEEILEVAAHIIAEGNLMKQEALNGESMTKIVSEISRIQGVAQGRVAQRLRELGADGTLLGDIQRDNTPGRLLEKVGNSPVGDLYGTDSREGAFAFSRSNYGALETVNGPWLPISVNRHEGNRGDRELQLLLRGHSEDLVLPVTFGDRQIHWRSDLWPLIESDHRFQGLGEISVELRSVNTEGDSVHLGSAYIDISGRFPSAESMEMEVAATKDGLRVSFQSAIGKSYRLEVSEDLGDWELLRVFGMSEGGETSDLQIEYVDPEINERPKRFYRVVPE